MDWSSNSYRSNFVLELLSMADEDVDGMMDTLYEVIVTNGPEIFEVNDRPVDELRNSMDQIIKWYADNELYEKCQQLKKIKEECLK